MRDQQKTKPSLVDEVASLRARVAELERARRDDTPLDGAAERSPTERAIDGQRRFFELLATGAALAEVLSALVAGVEAHINGGLCSVLLLDEERRRLYHGAAPSLPPGYIAAIDGSEIGPNAGSCGTAAALDTLIVAVDIATDPHWADYRDLAHTHGLHACCSSPFHDSQGAILGTFAIYYPTPRAPSDAEIAEIKNAAYLASIAVERTRFNVGEREQRVLAAALLDTAAALNSTLNLDAVLDRILDNIEHVTPQDAADIMVVEAEFARIIRYREYPHSNQEHSPIEARFVIVETSDLRHMLETQQPIMISDTRLYPGWVKLPQMAWIRSSLSAPIILKGQVIGFICIHSKTPGFFNATHTRHLQAFVDQAAIAIENARLYDDARRHTAELESRVAERTMQLAAANKELEAFSYSVSHDLRAPLRHIDGFAQLLAQREADKLDATSARYLRIVGESARRMGQLIDDLLGFSRMSRTELQTLPVDLGQMVDDIRYELAPMLDGRAITWAIGALPVVRGDPALVRVALVNLLSNAIKYTAPRPEAHISLTAADAGVDGCEITIRDNGVGFDMQYAHKLFGVFQRLHRDEEFEGTGIGLATVQRIINRHGGRVWAEGVLDGGATFHFTLKRHCQE
jgi:signal transduction histidine kinase